MTHIHLARLIQDKGLPLAFIDTVKTWYCAVAKDIAALYQNEPMVIGIQGSQGSGKSTLASFLQYLLKSEHALESAVLSIDDFYLRRSERQTLSERIHPLLKTRGVPGTHDVNLAIRTITALMEQKSGGNIHIPRFNKATDDRYDEQQWDSVPSGINVIILEGWCVGIGAQNQHELDTDINSLEKHEDATGHWRNYANNQLSHQYRTLFNLIDHLIVLNAPSFSCIRDWRWLQEKKLRQYYTDAGQDIPEHVMDEGDVERFISHYERLTRHAMNTLPQKADWLLTLNSDHTITDLSRAAHLQHLNEQVSR